MNTLEQLETEVKYDFNNGGPLVWTAATEQPKQTELVYANGRIFNYKTERHGHIPVADIMVVTAEERKRRVSEILAQDSRANIDRLTDVLLYEKLFNPSLTKMQDEEYPIMSERQFDRRQGTEFSTDDEALSNNASDGRKHRIPDRRKRSAYENKFVNKKARSTNRERKRKYNEFTRTQPVTRWNMYSGEIYE